jgi:hypothetical protein
VLDVDLAAARKHSRRCSNRSVLDFLNETALATHLARAHLFFQDLMQSIVAVKGTFDVLPSGDTRLTGEQPALQLEDQETPFGNVETEIVPAKAWCDVALLGHARSRSAHRPVTQMTVSLNIGSNFSRAVRVTGDREWTRVLGRLRPSPPRPFTELPLTYRHAFGGTARQADELDAGYFANPDGRGYVELKEDVEGCPLPNIEELDQPVRRWMDRPLPAGFAPLARSSILRAQRGVLVDIPNQITRIDPSAFCFSHPRMTLPFYPHGAEVQMVGATFGKPWRFRLPEFRYQLRLDLGGARYQLPLVADTLYLHPDEKRVVVVARAAFIYQFVPEKLRAVRVQPGPETPIGQQPTASGNPNILTTTIRKQRAAKEPTVPIVIPPSSVMELALEPVIAGHPLIDLIETLPLCPSG